MTDPHQALTGNARSLASRQAGPPDFCQLRALLGVAAVALLSSCLVSIGSTWPISFLAFAFQSLYAVTLGLFCAATVCLGRGLFDRLGTRDAWLSAWILVVLSALAFSYAVGVVSSVLGLGPGEAGLDVFVRKSVMGAAIVAVAMLRYLFIRTQWQLEMLSESEARVQALQARIRPHFLFNSLNTIASLIHDNPEAAERATEDLATLFRGGMRRADELVPLEEELGLARRYLDMEQRRLGDRLKVNWDTDDLSSEEPVLPMILQPLLENAVAHGIQPRVEGGTVQVIGVREGDYSVITVSNPAAADADTRGSGMALRNIRSRLVLMYRDRASLVTSLDNNHFYAVLKLPHAHAADN